MISNFLRLTLRNIRNNFGYTLVNVSGLSIGLFAAILIFLYVNDELSFDKIHPKSETTYRVGLTVKEQDGTLNSMTQIPAAWDQYLVDKYEGVIGSTGVMWFGMPNSLHYKETDKIILTEDLYWVKSTFPEILHLNIISGNKEKALDQVNNIVISESAAKKLFSDQDPVGKPISLKHVFITQGREIELIVSAVMEDYPTSSHIRPQYLVNLNSLKPFLENFDESMTAMGPPLSRPYQSYIVVKDAAVLDDLKADLQSVINEIIQRLNADVEVIPFFTPITAIHFDNAVQWTTEGSADIKYIYVFISIAILILIVACINYMNLATARSAKRAKEVGLRKTMGSSRQQLFFQFISESFLMVLMSAILAILLVWIFLPYFNQLSQKSFTIDALFNMNMLIILGAILLFVTFMAGSYPALYLSGFEPATVLKGKFRFGSGANRFRTFLTTAQFVVSIILLITTMIVVKQMNLMQESKLNEAGEQILSIRFGGTAPDEKYEVFKQQVLRNTRAEAVTIGNHLPRLEYFGSINMTVIFPEVSEEKLEWKQLNGDFDFPSAFGMELIAGRFFDKNNPGDSLTLLVNESVAQALNKTPEEVVGMSVAIPGGTSYQGFNFEELTYARVIGVVKDFPYRSMHFKIEPLLISPKPHFIDKIVYAKLPSENVTKHINDIENVWKETFPGVGFDYWFLDDEFKRMYLSEVKIARLSENFAGLAIIITCFGLLGLASFMSEQRTKEIGVRKALGASSIQVVVLLLTTFLKILLISCLIAVPASILLAREWLQNFVYQVELSPLIFLIAVSAVIFITVLLVSYETLKASLANPINSLRYE